MTTPRGQILEDARNLTEGDRNRTYGCPVANMGQFADLVTAYLQPKLMEGHRLTPVDAAVVMCLTKISRIGVNPNHRDSYVDLAAYAAIAGECAADAQEHAQLESQAESAYEPWPGTVIEEGRHPAYDPTIQRIAYDPVTNKTMLV